MMINADLSKVASNGVKLSIVIPCYNGAATLGETLAALVEQEWTEPWEIVFADNGSTDGSKAVAQKYANRMANFRIIDASARQGQPYALNAGVSAARGESVAFCDADDVVGEGWLQAMGTALSKYDFVAARMDIKKLNPSWVYSYRRNPQNDGLQKIGYPPYLLHAGGGTIGVKKSLHQAVNGFDDDFPYLHDTDFCFKIQNLGVQLHFIPDAIMHIRFRTNLSSIYRQSRNYAEYNVRLAKRYEKTALPRPDRWSRYWKEWVRVFTLARRSFKGKEAQANFLSRLGWQVGQLRGIIKYRSCPI